MPQGHAGTCPSKNRSPSLSLLPSFCTCPQPRAEMGQATGEEWDGAGTIKLFLLHAPVALGSDGALQRAHNLSGSTGEFLGSG